jgi:eukaryotic-like serine/threonine-protein kinase
MSSPQINPKSMKSLSNQQEPTEAGEGLPRVFERYLLLKRIARGGMGEVFLGTSAGAIEGAERPCVVKVIRREHAEDSSFLARFLDEARIQAQLEHPGVVRVLVASHDESGKPYVVLEHVEGRNLSEVRLRVQQLGVRMTWPDAVAVAIALTEALAHIHERTDAAGQPLAIVHRDLSPQNVMLGYAGDVKVIDFGTARGHNRRCHTVAGIVFAKPGYVAPEVANNQPGGIPADLYAVGIMLWEMLAGRRFIAGDAAEHLAAVAGGTKLVTPIAALVDAPPELDAICQRLTAPKLEDRFESASEACSDLALLLKRAPSTSDGQRSVRVRIAQLMQRLYPAEPTRTRAEFQRLIAASRCIAPPASALVPSPSPPPAETENSVPELLAGTRYQLGERIGEGASSIVYAALHVDLGRKVALKLYQANAEPDVLDAFRREARNVAALTHDNIVKVHDFGLTKDGRAYLSMEWLDGEPMDRRLADHGPLEYRAALSLGVQICRALETAHAAGIVHGDLKPANLFLTRQGTIKLLDFGVSALGRERRTHQSDAESFSLVGTPEYLAPEQIHGQEPSVQTDLYAFGVVLYELLTQTRPHDADSLGVLLGHKLDGHVEAPSLRVPMSRLPKAVDRLCLRLLSPKPEQRYASAAALRLAIERILDGMAEGQRKATRSLRLTAGAVMLTLGATALLMRVPELRRDAWAMTQGVQRFASGALAQLEVPALGHGMRAIQLQAERAILLAKRELGEPLRVAEQPAAVSPGIDAEPEGTADRLATTSDEASEPESVEAEPKRSDETSNSSAATPKTSNPTSKTAANDLARIEHALRDNKPLHALDIARHVDAAARRNPVLLRHWVSAAMDTRAWGEAHRRAKELNLLQPNAENQMLLANLERRMGRTDDARKTLDRLLAAEPNHAEAKALKVRLEPSARVAAR